MTIVLHTKDERTITGIPHCDLDMAAGGIGEGMLVAVGEQFAEDHAELDGGVRVTVDTGGVHVKAHRAAGGVEHGGDGLGQIVEEHAEVHGGKIGLSVELMVDQGH